MSDDSGGLGALGWFVLILLVAGLIGGVLIWRSRRKADRTAEADALAAETRLVVSTRLPAVLAMGSAAQRALAWPSVRADLVALASRWALLGTDGAEERLWDWSRRVGYLIGELVAAMDAENEVLASGGEWRLLRPRVQDAERTLSATLAEGPGNRGPQPQDRFS